MRHLCFAILAGALLAPAVHAAEIHVLAPGSVTPPAKELALAFTEETGTTVVFGGGGREKILGMVKAGTGGDLVILPAGDIDALAASLKPGSRTALVRIPVGVAVKAGAPLPDISTREKFRAALLAENAVSYSDPAIGSSAGAVIDSLLKRPEFAGVKRKPVMGLAVTALAAGQTDMALQMITEIPGVAGIVLVGPVPASLDADVDFAAGVPASAAAPVDALAFLHYITRPEATSVWASKGIELDRK